MAVLMSAVALGGCGTKKNTAMSRNYQAFITRYNIYYNGDTHYKETLADMESKYEDDYSRMVFMHPIDAKNDPKAPQPSGSFDRSIEKAQKAIQIRSIKKRPAKKSGKHDAKYKEWMKREEYNPFLHNSWMMMGRGQYFNGDFLGAASTFLYISKHFKWLPKTVTEAKLWQARSYVSMGWLFEAETILTRIKPDDIATSGTLTTLYNFTYADYHIKSENYEQSVPYLEAAAKGAKGAQKTRLNFLLGQIYARIGQNQKAYKAYQKAGSASSASYRTKFNARIKQSEVYQGNNIEPEVKALKRMTKYDRNKEYLDQVYYAIGNLYLTRGDTVHAIENYELAAQKSTRNGIDKAISQLTLGNLYFIKRKYEKAQPCYAEAIPQITESYPDYEMLKRRSDVLDELAIYSQNVTLQDSLLKLSAMSDEERMKVIEKIIKELKEKEKKEAEEAKREEYLSQQQAQGSNMNSNSASAPTSFSINSDNSWYFYNTATKNAGKTEFQKRWGSRKLEDDWRRRNKATFSTSDFDNDNDGENAENGDNPQANDTTNISPEEKEKLAKSEDPHYPEYYLKQIPQTDEEKANAHAIIQEGLYMMGVILKDKLEDYEAAMVQFNRLLKDYPDNTYRLDVYYNIYLMYMRQDKTAEAETYRQLILSDFADSKYGLAMKNPNYLEDLRTMDDRQEKLYDETYQHYLNNENSKVHEAYDEMMDKNPLSKIMPKFMFLHALAYVTEHNTDKFNETLRDLLERYPDSDVSPIASSWVKGMAKGRKINEGATNMRGMIWETRLSNDSIAGENAEEIKFEMNPNSPQLLVLLFPIDQVSSNQLLYEVARFNFSSFVVRDFDLEQMNFGRLGMILIKGFENQAQLDHYRKVMSSSSMIKLPEQVRPIEISVENFDKLLKASGSFEDYFKYIEEKTYEDTEEKVLGPTDDNETPAEAEEQAEPEAQDEKETVEESEVQ
jgi:tetratricopeptide (TPR) repeat protein